MKTFAAALLILFSMGAAAQQQNFSLQGIVVEAGTNKPLPGVSLELRALQDVTQVVMDPVTGQVLSGNNFLLPGAGNGTPVYPGLTAGDGQFVFRNLPAGRYALMASRNGYMHAEFGQRGPNGKGMTLTVAAGQAMSGIRLTMTRSGAISGHVYDSRGLLLAYVQMQMRRVTYPDGQRTLTTTASTVTDDLGAYRLYGLPPGAYVLSAQTNTPTVGITPVAASRTPPVPGVVVFQSASGPMMTDSDPANQNRRKDSGVSLFYPNAIQSANATVIDVRPGDDIGGVNVTIDNLKAQTVLVSWSLSAGSNPQSLVNLQVSSTGAENSIQVNLGLPPGISPSPRSLPVGSYVALALELGNTPTPTTVGYAAFDTGTAPTSRVSIVMSPLRDVSGHVSSDGVSAADIAGLKINFRRDPAINLNGSPPPSAAPAQDGSWVAKGFIEGEYIVTVNGLPDSFRNAYVKSIKASNAEVLGNRLRVPAQSNDGIAMEVVIGANGGQIEGRAVAETGEPLSNVTVLLVPDSSDHRDLYKTIVTDAAGRYHFEGVTPGNYRLFSWEDVEPDIWYKPAFLTPVQDRGKAIRISEGSRESVDVTAIPFR